MYWAVDQLASEYGWWKDDILDKVYFDELYMLLENMQYRKTEEYQMQLAIASNPHSETPKDLWAELRRQSRHYLPPENFDPMEMERLKARLSGKFKIL